MKLTSNWRQFNPDKRAKVLQNKFGISTRQYNQMFDKQNGCCLLCEKHQAEFKKRFAVDHDHATGQVRGLLCMNCNCDLGKYEANKDKYAAYLKSAGLRKI